MKAVDLLSVSKVILLAFYLTRVMVSKILHRQWQMKSSDGMMLTKRDRRNWKGLWGETRILAKKKTMCCCLFTHHKFHMNRRGTEIFLSLL